MTTETTFLASCFLDDEEELKIEEEEEEEEMKLWPHQGSCRLTKHLVSGYLSLDDSTSDDQSVTYQESVAETTLEGISLSDGQSASLFEYSEDESSKSGCFGGGGGSNGGRAVKLMVSRVPSLLDPSLLHHQRDDDNGEGDDHSSEVSSLQLGDSYFYQPQMLPKSLLFQQQSQPLSSANSLDDDISAILLDEDSTEIYEDDDQSSSVASKQQQQQHGDISSTSISSSQSYDQKDSEEEGEETKEQESSSSSVEQEDDGDYWQEDTLEKSFHSQSDYEGEGEEKEDVNNGDIIISTQEGWTAYNQERGRSFAQQLLRNARAKQEQKSNASRGGTKILHKLLQRNPALSKATTIEADQYQVFDATVQTPTKTSDDNDNVVIFDDADDDDDDDDDDDLTVTTNSDSNNSRGSPRNVMQLGMCNKTEVPAKIIPAALLGRPSTSELAKELGVMDISQMLEALNTTSSVLLQELPIPERPTDTIPSKIIYGIEVPDYDRFVQESMKEFHARLVR